MENFLKRTLQGGSYKGESKKQQKPWGPRVDLHGFLLTTPVTYKSRTDDYYIQVTVDYGIGTHRDARALPVAAHLYFFIYSFIFK